MIIRHRADGSTPPHPAKPMQPAKSAADPPAVRPSPATEDVSRDIPPSIPFLHFDRIVGRGGMAVVWRAWHKELCKFVAVKVLDSKYSLSGRDLRQFMVEVKTMSSLHHPGIVQGYGADCADGRYYFIMDYVDGYTFGALLKRKSRLPQVDALIICESVAEAMRYAWDEFGIIHCDIKPDNIMVDRDGTVKVLDLGLCQSTAMFRNSGQAEEVVGTPAYLSPEQIYGDVELDCRADIYNLGATLYHLTTGRMLFPIMSNDDILRAHVDPQQQAPDPRTISPLLTEGFVRLMAGMLVKERDQRYQTWDDVLYDARIVEAGETLPPLPDGTVSSIRLQTP